VLVLSWDVDVTLLRQAVTAHLSRPDIVLSLDEEAAHGRVADRINCLWCYGSGLDRFRF
jgi:hypothetical protein